MILRPERLHRALVEAVTFRCFAESAGEDLDAYEHVQFDDDDRARLASITTPVDVLAIVGHGCTDVIATLPIVACVADACAAISLHVLERTSNPDLADAYARGGASRIPTYVFVDADGRERGLIIERTEEIHRQVATFLRSFLAEHPHVDLASFPYSLSDAERADLLARGKQLRRDVRDLERRSLVAAIHQIAS